jgi:hypothetical protein
MLELAFADAAARGRALAGAEVAAALRELPRHAAALHTYPEVATYTLVHGDRPTLVGLKGLPVAETILATGAENQAQPEVLRLLHGPDIGAPSATAFRSRSQAGAR